MLTLFRRFLKRYAGFVVAACLCTILQVFCDLMLPDMMSDIIDTGVVEGDVGYIMSMGIKMLGWALLSMAAVIIAAFFSARTAMGFGRDVRSAIYKQVTRFSLREADDFGTSSLITRTTNDVQQLERFLQMGMTIALMSPVMFVGAAAMSFMTSPSLSIIVFIAIPILLAVVIVAIKLTTPLLRSLQERIDLLNRVTREGLTGIRVIRAYRKEDYEEARFDKANKGLADTNVSVARRMGALMPVIMLIMNLATVFIVWFGGLSIQAGELQVGSMMAVIQYAMLVLSSVMMLSMVFMLWPRAMAAATRIKEVLECEPLITDEAEGVAEFDSTVKPRSLVFENVTFGFPGSEEPALSDVSLEFEPGLTYALIGSTGSGKSTIINLIERFIEPASGRILLDGVDTSKIEQDVLRGAISYVPQKTVLFSGSIADNIRYGNPEADDELVYSAARSAQAADFIMEKPEGYETQITQAGGGLSGGQKQRLAIARALAKPAGLYIFDDSFSALDLKTDALVRNALSHDTAGATVIIVAQRVAAAMDADRVVVLDEGRVVGVGTHDELVDSCEVYREIALSQLDEEEVE